MMQLLAFEVDLAFVVLVVGVVIAGGLLGRYLSRRFPPDDHALARQAEMKAHLAENKRRKQLKKDRKRN